MNEKKKNIIIIGAGAFGLSTAYHALQQGYTSVTVLESSSIFPNPLAATTDLNKIIRVDYGSDTLYQDLGYESILKWKEWNLDSMTRFGKIIFHQVGVAYLCRDMDKGFEKDSIENMSSDARLKDSIMQFDSNSYSSLDGMRIHYPHGYVNTLGGWGNSGLAVKYLHQVILELGANVITGDAGTFKELILKDSVAIGVQTSDGKEHYASHIVLCSGSWSPSLIPNELGKVLQSTGHPVIHMQIPDHLLSTYSPPHFPVWSADISHTGLYGFPVNEDGIMKIAIHGKGYTSKQHPSGISIPVTLPSDCIPSDILGKYHSFIADCLPELSNVKIKSSRMCWYTDSHDGDFYICSSPTISNLSYATGGSGHAFKFMPLLGRIVMDVIHGKSTPATDRFAWRIPSSIKKESCRNDKDELIDLKGCEIALV